MACATRSPTSSTRLGASVDVVAKCLNHSSSKTTAKFYLKESIEEVTNRANIPWLQGSSRKREPPLPAFLDCAGESSKEKQANKRQKLDQALSALDVI